MCVDEISGRSQASREGAVSSCELKQACALHPWSSPGSEQWTSSREVPPVPIHGLQSLDVIWVHPQAQQAAGHRDHFPVHLVQKDLSLTPSWVFLFKAICYVFWWCTKCFSIHTFYHIKQEVTVLKRSEKEIYRFPLQGKKLKISTGMHFPSFLSFKDFTWLVTVLPTACVHIK